MKTMIDPNGYEIPVNRINAYDRKRDAVCRRIEKRFREERERLKRLMADSLADIAELRQFTVQKKYTTKDGKTKIRGERGNFQTSSFDGLIQIEIRQQYNILLDSRVQQARELMLGYVNNVLNRVSGADTTVLRKLVESAFRANSKGFLPVSKIFELMRMEVKDAHWNEARDVLQDALQPTKGKRYLTCSTRKSTQGDFAAIRLDLADCWPEEEGDAQ